MGASDEAERRRKLEELRQETYRRQEAEEQARQAAERAKRQAEVDQAMKKFGKK